MAAGPPEIESENKKICQCIFARKEFKVKKILRLKQGVLSLSCILIITSMILSGCGESSLYSDTPSDYETIYEVDGISFALPNRFLTAATAVTEITANSDFAEDGVYLYKDGESSYILFSMSQIVIVCEKGTRFDFTTADDCAAALDNSSILGVWMASTKKKGLDYTSSNDGDAYKLIANVTAQVSMTTNLFGDFVGKLASVKTADDEWSLFIGIPGDSMSDIPSVQMKVINSVAKSIKVDTAASNETSYEYTDGETTEESGAAATDEAAPSDASTITKEDSEASAAGNSDISEATSESDGNESDTESNALSTEENVSDNTTNNSDSEDSKPDDSGDPATKEDTSETDTTEESAPENAEVSGTDNSSDSSSEQSSISEASATTNTHATETRPEAGTSSSISVSNQKEAKANKKGAKNSSIYSFLKVGEKGILDALSEETTKAEEIAVTLKATYKGQEAINKIKEFIASGKAGYEYTEPPVGALWEVAEYDIDYGDVTDAPYVNVSLYGVDGTKLKKSGVAYPTRTYDMNYLAKEDGSGYMVYYAVPLNCSEYVICAGMGSIDNDFKSAYYLIKEN